MVPRTQEQRRGDEAVDLPGGVHAIDKPASEADQWLNIAGWLKKHFELGLGSPKY